MSYRSDREAFRTRLAELEGSVAELDAKVRELETLRSDAEAARRARDDLRELVQQIDRCRSSYASLGEVRIASPCHERWRDMPGDDQVRHCGRCDKNVYDLSALTRDEADRLVREREGSMCVRFFQRSDGTMLTADCQNGVRRRRLRVLAIVAVGIAGVGVASAVNIATDRALDAPHEEPRARVIAEQPRATATPTTPPEVHHVEALGGIGHVVETSEVDAQITHAHALKRKLEGRLAR